MIMYNSATNSQFLKNNIIQTTQQQNIFVQELQAKLQNVLQQQNSATTNKLDEIDVVSQQPITTSPSQQQQINLDFQTLISKLLFSGTTFNEQPQPLQQQFLLPQQLHFLQPFIQTPKEASIWHQIVMFQQQQTINPTTQQQISPQLQQQELSQPITINNYDQLNQFLALSALMNRK